MNFLQEIEFTITGKNPARRAAPKVQHYAIFPTGEKQEITRSGIKNGRASGYEVRDPAGKKHSNTKLADLKHFLEFDFPGIRFTEAP